MKISPFLFQFEIEYANQKLICFIRIVLQINIR
jgi:hypothetical protein